MVILKKDNRPDYQTNRPVKTSSFPTNGTDCNIQNFSTKLILMDAHAAAPQTTSIPDGFNSRQTEQPNQTLITTIQPQRGRHQIQLSADDLPTNEADVDTSTPIQQLYRSTVIINRKRIPIQPLHIHAFSSSKQQHDIFMTVDQTQWQYQAKIQFII